MKKKVYTGLQMESVIFIPSTNLLTASGEAKNSIKLQNIEVEEYIDLGPFEVDFNQIQL